ncbi:hypothetical protein Tco_1459100 [Tanacetum coccineum]
MEQMFLTKQDKAGVTLTNEQNDFLVADATRMEEIEELSANICLVAKFQPTNIDSDAGPSYDSAFLNFNSGSVEYDNNVQASYELEQLARNAYKEAEKQQINAKKADRKARRIEKDLQNQFIRDRDIIRDLEQQQDKLKLSVVELKRQDIKEMKEVFDSAKSDFNATWKHNELLNDQLLEATINHEIVCCVLLSHECESNNVQDEIEKIQRDSIEIQEGMQKQINILENGVQRCQKQSLDFELQLQHEKERRKCESSLKNVCKTSWISKIEKLESENVSLEFQVHSLTKERENVKSKYQKLFDSIKKTRTQTQGEINELIEHVIQKTYAYVEVRAHNQDFLITISKLKTKQKNAKKGLSATSSVRRPLNRDSLLKNSVLSNTKKSSEKVESFC